MNNRGPKQARLEGVRAKEEQLHHFSFEKIGFSVKLSIENIKSIHILTIPLPFNFKKINNKTSPTNSPSFFRAPD